jgi:hypothetical protein
VEALWREWAGRGEEVARWRRARQTRPGGEYGAEEAIGDVAWRSATRWGTGDNEAEWGGQMVMAMQGGNNVASLGAHGWDE